MTDQTKERAAIYCRISSDREGREWGVDDQEFLCRERAEQLGYEVVDVIVENDLSASTISKKRRPLYDDMMRRAEAGEFKAIIAGSSSRLTRRPREGEDIIDRAIAFGLRIHYTKGSDPEFDTARGRRRARGDASDDAAEAEETSERVKNAVRRRIRDGQWHGGSAPFGYRAVRSDQDGRLRKLLIEPSEAVVVERIATAILEGKTLYRIAQDLKRDGIKTREVRMKPKPGRKPGTTRGGKFFGPQVIRTLMLGGTIAGLRRHRERDLNSRVVSDELHEGYCEPIIDRDRWDQIRAILEDPRRDFAKGLRGGYGGKRALGGGLAVCGVCGHKLVSAPYCRHKPDENGKRPCDDDPALREREVRLACKVNADGGCGKVGVPNVQLEEFILNLVWARLDDPKFVIALRKPVEKANDREAILKAERRLLDGRLDRVQEGFLSGILDGRKAKQEIEGIEQQQQKIDRELEGLRTKDSLAGVSNAKDGQALWARSSVLARRDFLTSMIRRIKVDEWPRGEDGRKMPSSLTRRTDSRRSYDPETHEQFTKRKTDHAAKMLRLRIPPSNIEWLA